MTNILFCYWLQGYFEISCAPSLEISKVKMMAMNIEKISEPLLPEIQWIKNVCHFFETMDYKPETLEIFMPFIQNNLNAVFYHFLDNDKDIEYSLEELEQLHAGNNV